MDTGAYMQNQMDNQIEAGNQLKNYLDELKDKYKEIPYEIKREIVDRDWKNMFGYDYIDHTGTPFYIAFENALDNLSKTVKKNIINKIVKNILIPNEYWALQRSGKFFEFFPEMTGVLGEDIEEFSKFWFEREEKKGWIKLILG